MLDASHLADWKCLARTEASPWLAEVASADPTSAAALERLRAAVQPAPREPDGAHASDHADPGSVCWSLPLAIELVRARKRAAIKFPNADELMADVSGVEQATSHAIAEHKAARFAEHFAGRAVRDLCCGIGGDAMSLAKSVDLTVVDTSPVRTWMAATNASCAGWTTDVVDTDLQPLPFHIDPARRDEDSGRRRHRYEDYRPTPAELERLIATHRDGAVKLGPGVSLHEIEGADEREIELISENGSVRQAVLWCGALAQAPGQRSATLLPSGHTLTGIPGPVTRRAAGAARRFILVADPAVERAELLGAAIEDHAASEIHPGLGLLTSDECPHAPWFTPFEVIETIPWRPKRLRLRLRDLDAGIVEVKTRGGAIDAMDAQRRLRGDGDQAYTVFGLRLGTKVVGVITRRVDAAPTTFGRA